MTFWLMRHAKSSWPDGVFDIDRPLSSRGRADAKRMGQRLARDPPKRIVASPARRAQETAQAVADACGLQVETVEDLYPGSAHLYRAHATDGTLVVGHNPGMGEAIMSLGHVDPAPTGKLVPTATVGRFEDGELMVMRPADSD